MGMLDTGLLGLCPDSQMQTESLLHASPQACQGGPLMLGTPTQVKVLSGSLA